MIKKAALWTGWTALAMFVLWLLSLPIQWLDGEWIGWRNSVGIFVLTPIVTPIVILVLAGPVEALQRLERRRFTQPKADRDDP